MNAHPHIQFGATTGSKTLTAGVLPELADVKAHLRVDFNDDDTYIGDIMTAVRSYIEDYCDVAFGTITHTAYWDYAYPLVNVPKKFDTIAILGAGDADLTPTLSVKQADGSYVAATADSYDVDYVSNPIRVHMKSGFSESGRTLNRYKFTFTTVALTVPEYVFQAFLMIAGHYYENRQDVGKERIFEVPMNSRYLLNRYRQQSFV
jgi:uncharacterized phiE125 gp8 family phage protein